MYRSLSTSSHCTIARDSGRQLGCFLPQPNSYMNLIFDCNINNSIIKPGWSSRMIRALDRLNCARSRVQIAVRALLSSPVSMIQAENRFLDVWNIFEAYCGNMHEDAYQTSLASYHLIALLILFHLNHHSCRLLEYSWSNVRFCDCNRWGSIPGNSAPLADLSRDNHDVGD